MCRHWNNCGGREISFITINLLLGIMGVIYLLQSENAPEPSVIMGFFILILDLACLLARDWKRPVGQLVMVACKFVSVIWLSTEGIGSGCDVCPFDLAASLLAIFGAILFSISAALSTWSAIILWFCTASADLNAGDGVEIP